MQNDNLPERRHSLAHLLAAAVKELYPDALPTIGPAIENGFYYDFDFPAAKPGEDELSKIEDKMRQILPTFTDFEKISISADEAREKFKDNPYKLELISEILEKGEELTLYKSGDFVDLCRGGHADNLNKIDPESFKLSHLAGAYWRGDEKNKQLTRIYGLAFESKQRLEEYVLMQEEAKKRDHRKLGKELELFTIIDEIGGGLPLFYPKGAILRKEVENYISVVQERRGYTPIWIPHITKGKLYEISGHLEKYDAMYPPMELKDEANYYLKPMNCPHFMMLYKSQPHSYKQLPVRYVCTTTNYRYEKSGELSGLTRVRALTQDDCHVFATPEQIRSEIELMLDMVEEVYKTFGFLNFKVRISTHDPENKDKYIGDPQIWEESENTLAKLIKERSWEHEIGVGEAAFYGPKLDFIFKDVIGREWQLSTIQLDMNLPKRFLLEYIGPDSSKKTPIVIHRAILGSTERFLGILIEHYGGNFPVWLSPVQVKILPIADTHTEYARTVLEKLKATGIRAELDESNETLGKKIREAKMQKVPYIFVIGDKEIAEESVGVESRDYGQMGMTKIDAAIEKLKTEIKDRMGKV